MPNGFGQGDTLVGDAPAEKFWLNDIPASLGETLEAAYAPDVNKEINQSWFPNFKSIGVQAGAQIRGLAAAPFSKYDSAVAYAKARAYETAAAERSRKEVAISPTVEPYIAKTFRGAGATIPGAALGGMIGGPYGAVAAGAGMEYGSSLDQARNAGLSEHAAQAHAITQGVIEGGVSAIFQKIGLGGLETTLGKAGSEGVRQGFLKTIKAAGIRTLQELPEEVITSIGQSVQSKLSGVDPKALSAESLQQTIADTTAQTLMTMGLVESPNILASSTHATSAQAFKNSPARADIRTQQAQQTAQFTSPENVQNLLAAARESGNAEALQALAGVEQPSRADWEKAGLPPAMQRGGASRKAFADQLRYALAKESAPPVAEGLPAPGDAGIRLDKGRLNDVAAREAAAPPDDIRPPQAPVAPLNNAWQEVPKGSPIMGGGDIEAFTHPDGRQFFRLNQGGPSLQQQTDARQSELQAMTIGQINQQGSQYGFKRGVSKSKAIDRILTFEADKTVAGVTEPAQPAVAIGGNPVAAGPAANAVTPVQPTEQPVAPTSQGETNAALSGQQPQNGQQEPLGTQAGTAPRQNGQEVRSQEGPQDRRGDSTEQGTGRSKVPAGVVVEKLAQLKSWEGFDVKAVEPKSQDQADAADFVRARGYTPVFLEGANGERLSFRGMHSQGHVFLNGTFDGNALWDTVGHEVAHATGFDKTTKIEESLINETVKRHEEFMAPKYRELLKSDPPRRRREGIAYMVGEFMRDPAFRAQVAQRAPTLWQRIKDAVLKAVGKFSPRDLAARETLAMLQKSALPNTTAKPAPLTISPAALGITPGGIGTSLGNLGEGIVSTWKKWMTSAGNLPKEVFDRSLAKDGSIARELKQLQFELTGLKDSLLKTSGSTTLSPAGVETLNAAIRSDPSALASLTPEVREAVQAARRHIDALSQRMIDNGLAQGELEITFDANKGAYITRSYEVFDNPKWKDKVDPQVRVKAHALMRQELQVPSNLDTLSYGELVSLAAERGIMPADRAGVDRQNLTDLLEHYVVTDHQISNMIDDMLTKEGATSYVSGGRLGAKDMSIVKKRSEIPPEIRALLGEHKDPFVNLARSITKMAHLASNHEFLTDVRTAGMGKFFFEQDDPQRPAGNNVKFAADQSNVMAPLNGLMTTPEIKQAFDTAFGKQGMGGDLWDGFFRTYMKGLTASKYAKTVLGFPTAWIRNFLGNPYFALQNGHWNVTRLFPAFRATAESVRPALPDFARQWTTSSDAWQKRVLRYSELNLLDQDIHAADLRDSLNESMKPVSASVAANPLYQAVQKGGAALQGGYQAMDSPWRVMMFESELARRKAAFESAGKPFDVAEQEAESARIVNNTFTSYALIPALVKSLRRAPLVGTFVSFPSEVIRTQYHSLLQATKELQDPVLRGIGAQRLAGNLLAMGLPTALAAAARMLIGVSRKDEEDLRQFIAPWSKNSDILWISRGKDGKSPGYVDMSFTLPSSVYRKPIIAAMRGEDWASSFHDATGEFLTPFLGEEMLTEKFIDIARNQTKDGRQVYNEQAGPTERLKAQVGHVWQAVEPGFVTTFERNRKAWAGTVERSGRKYDPLTEGIAAGGFRAVQTDIPNAMSYAARKYAEADKEATGLFSGVYGSRGAVKPGEVQAAYVSAEKSKQQLFDDIHRKAHAAINLGVSEEEVASILDSSGLSRDDVTDVLSGSRLPYMLTKPLSERGTPERQAEYEKALNEVLGPEAKQRVVEKRMERYVRDLGDTLSQTTPKSFKDKGLKYTDYRKQFMDKIAEAKAGVKDSGIERGKVLGIFDKQTAHLEPAARRKQRGVLLSRLSQK